MIRFFKKVLVAHRTWIMVCIVSVVIVSVTLKYLGLTAPKYLWDRPNFPISEKVFIRTNPSYMLADHDGRFLHQGTLEMINFKKGDRDVLICKLAFIIFDQDQSSDSQNDELEDFEFSDDSFEMRYRYIEINIETLEKKEIQEKNLDRLMTPRDFMLNYE